MAKAETVLIIGANGQLGRSLQRIENDYPLLRCVFVGREQLDLAKPEQMAAYLNNTPADYIINAAAYTAVDKAETESDLAEVINHHAVARLAQWSKQHQVPLFHVSTDYVFDGCHYKPYREGDEPNPQGVYGSSKREGELAMLEINPPGCIIRTSWLYSEFGHNFVNTMLRLAQERDEICVVNDQVGSPTYATDLALAILLLIERGQQRSTQKTVLYHYANQGVASWYDLAQATIEMSNNTCNVIPISTEQYPTLAKRPSYSVLNSEKIEQQLQMTAPYWRDSLKQCIQQITK